MPHFDQTGPSGQGPMTGRRQGRCTNSGAGKGRKSADETTDVGQGRPGRNKGRIGRGKGMGMQNRIRGNR